ncbi:MAG TPA: STN and carboxypeptidase regulatory-like domain-containing protein [Sphingobacteriaceae bacterium]
MILFLFLLSSMKLDAQELVRRTRYLYKPLDVEVKNARLKDVLDGIAGKGNFYFSYSPDVIPGDSIVSVSAKNTPIKEILDRLLGPRFEYRESAGYLIIRPAFHRFSITPAMIKNSKREYRISGYVTDEKTGKPVQDASVYEKRLLKSAFTDEDGYFELRFRGTHQLVILSASRENYRDTTVMFLADITIKPEGYVDSAGSRVGNELSGLVEKAGLGRFLLSSRQRIQSLNIPDFLANTPFQASLTPGLSSHGMMSSSVVNKASLNVLGGYTAGVNGVELAGLFNINKGSMQYVQVAGLTNMVGGSVHGVQVGGLVNTVLGEVTGVQVGGVINTVKESATGVQIAGVANKADSLNGVQIAGVSNFTNSTHSGGQIAGIANISVADINGIQLAGIMNVSRAGLKGTQIGLINASKVQNGLQIGLVNLADTSSGYSIGLFNWVRKGYHKLVLSSTEVMNTNLSFKTGNAKLYTIIAGGMNVSKAQRIYGAGLGLGHDFNVSAAFSVSAELSSKYLYRGDFEQINLLNKVESNLQWQLMKSFTLFAGPSYNILTGNKTSVAVAGYKTEIAPRKHHQLGSKKGWIGWNAGICIF